MSESLIFTGGKKCTLKSLSHPPSVALDPWVKQGPRHSACTIQCTEGDRRHAVASEPGYRTLQNVADSPVVSCSSSMSLLSASSSCSETLISTRHECNQSGKLTTPTSKTWAVQGGRAGWGVGGDRREPPFLTEPKFQNYKVSSEEKKQTYRSRLVGCVWGFCRTQSCEPSLIPCTSQSQTILHVPRTTTHSSESYYINQSQTILHVPKATTHSSEDNFTCP